MSSQLDLRQGKINKTFLRRKIKSFRFLIALDKTTELEETKQRYNEVSDKMMEKNRQYLKLQVKYWTQEFKVARNTLRRLTFVR